MWYKESVCEEARWLLCIVSNVATSCACTVSFDTFITMSDSRRELRDFFMKLIFSVKKKSILYSADLTSAHTMETTFTMQCNMKLSRVCSRLFILINRQLSIMLAQLLNLRLSIFLNLLYIDCSVAFCQPSIKTWWWWWVSKITRDCWVVLLCYSWCTSSGAFACVVSRSLFTSLLSVLI